jgi:hypothetical protein
VTSRTAVLASLLGCLVCTAAPPAGAGPRVDYMLECQGCHLGDGSGSPGAVPDLRVSLGPLLRAPDGRAFLVRVPGSALSPLSDAELAAVLNWMIASFAPRATAKSFVPYGATEVGGLRAEPLLEVDRVRAELLRANGVVEGRGP